MGVLLSVCGMTAAIVGGWRGYAVAREALAPLAHPGDATRTAMESTQPVHARPRVRLFVRRVAISLGWILVAMYGLFLFAAGQEVRS